MSIDRLPDAARAKFIALEQASSDARALLVTATERRGRADERALLLRQKLKTIDPAGTRHGELTSEIVRIESELELLTQQQQARSDRHANAAQIVAEIKGWLQTLPADAVLEDATLSAPGVLRRGDNAAAALERTRHDLAAAQAELQQVQFSPPTSGEIEKQITDYVERLRRAGAPLITATHEKLAVSWFGATPGTPSPALGPQQIAAMLAWLDPETFTAQLIDTFAAMPSSAPGVSAADKKRRSAALTATIERLERQEEAIIEQAARGGVELLRRPHAAPAAILGVRAVPRVAAVAA